MMKENNIEEVNIICAKHQICIRDLLVNTSSLEKKIYSINRKYLVRVADTPMTLELEKFRRVERLNYVPKILHYGEITNTTGVIYYSIFSLLPGDDFVNFFPESTFGQQTQLGYDIANFLDNLEKITGTHYDLGLYIPVIPHFSGTWQEGHQNYWEILEQGSSKLNLEPESLRVFNMAFKFLQDFRTALDFQTGPKLLHNDLHPRNIILHQGQFSGVIDWECSQFGEADFELCHLIHWCVYPPKTDINYRPFLRALFQAAPKCAQVPDFVQRLSIYQIEHEIQQILWHGSAVESWRIPRIVHWMTGGVETLFREIQELYSNED